MHGISVLIKEALENAAHHMRTWREVGPLQPWRGGEGLHRNSAMLVSYQDINLQNCEEEMFVFIKHPVYGTLLWKPEWTKSLGKGRRNYYRYQYIWGTFQKIVLFTSSNPAKQILPLFCRRCSGNVATSSCLANFSCTESRADPKRQMK